MSKDSDFDMLVVMREPVHRRQTAQKIYRNLHGTGVAVDIVVATEKDLEKLWSERGDNFEIGPARGARTL